MKSAKLEKSASRGVFSSASGVPPPDAPHGARSRLWVSCRGLPSTPCHPSPPPPPPNCLCWYLLAMTTQSQEWLIPLKMLLHSMVAWFSAKRYHRKRSYLDYRTDNICVLEVTNLLYYSKNFRGNPIGKEAATIIGCQGPKDSLKSKKKPAKVSFCLVALRGCSECS